MLWSIVSSVFVLYLYRKLNAADASVTGAAPRSAGSVDAALASLNERINSLESQLSAPARETVA